MLASPQQSQWRGRAGLSPASLLSFEQKHQKQTAHLDYSLTGVCVKREQLGLGQEFRYGLTRSLTPTLSSLTPQRSCLRCIDFNRGVGDLLFVHVPRKADPPQKAREG